jgi:hypothetical protein
MQLFQMLATRLPNLGSLIVVYCVALGFTDELDTLVRVTPSFSVIVDIVTDKTIQFHLRCV